MERRVAIDTHLPACRLRTTHTLTSCLCLHIGQGNKQRKQQYEQKA
jgi:hypothetical protein